MIPTHGSADKLPPSLPKTEPPKRNVVIGHPNLDGKKNQPITVKKIKDPTPPSPPISASVMGVTAATTAEMIAGDEAATK